MPFLDLTEFVDETLTLSIHGKQWTIYAPDAATGLEAQRVMSVSNSALAGMPAPSAARDELTDSEEADLYCKLLGGKKTVDVVKPNPDHNLKMWTPLEDGEEPTDVPNLKTPEGMKLNPDYDPRANITETIPNPHYDSERDVWAQLFASGYSWLIIKHVGVTVMIWTTTSTDQAMNYWNAGIQAPKAPKVPQDRKRAAGRRTGTGTRKASPAGTTRTPPQQ